jgi:hypothetical protein
VQGAPEVVALWSSASGAAGASRRRGRNARAPQRGEDVGIGASCLNERCGEGEGARGEFVAEAEALGRGDAREGKLRQRLVPGEANATATLRPCAYGEPC